MMEMVEFQFLVTFVVCLLSSRIIEFLGFNKTDVTPVFIILLLGSFFQILFLNLIVLSWYLELLNESLLCVFIFTLLNGVFTYIQLYYTNLPLGTGYLAAIIITFLILLILFIYRLRELNYLTFARSNKLEATPVAMPKFN